MMRISFLFLAVVFFLSLASAPLAQAGNAAGVKREAKAVPSAASAPSARGGEKSAPAKGESPETKTSGTVEAVEEKADRVMDAAEGEAEADSATVEDPLSYTRPVYTYNPEGRRDPFESLVPEENKDEKKIKGLFNYEKATLRGIARSEGSLYAMAVDGDNYAYVLRENDPVFGGYVTKITDDAVHLHIVKYGRAMSIILRMETARKTILAREEDDSVVRRPGITVAWGKGRESGATMGVEEVTVPSLETKTVEEVWFGSAGKGGGKAGASSPYLLLSPSENAEVRLPAVLRWTKSAQDSVFTLIIAGDRDFKTPLLVKEGIRGSTFLLESNPAREHGGPLYWKVIARHRSGEQINSRNILSFRIQ